MKSLVLSILLLSSTALALPQVIITTNSELDGKAKTAMESAHFSIQGDGKDTHFNLETEMKIRFRGNSTRTMEKRSFRLKLSSSQSILGMPEDKDWVLVAN